MFYKNSGKKRLKVFEAYEPCSIRCPIRKIVKDTSFNTMKKIWQLYHLLLQKERKIPLYESLQYIIVKYLYHFGRQSINLSDYRQIWKIKCFILKTCPAMQKFIFLPTLTRRRRITQYIFIQWRSQVGGGF